MGLDLRVDRRVAPGPADLRPLGAGEAGEEILIDAAEQIDLSAVSAIASLADLDLADPNAGAVTQVGADVVIDLSGGNSVTLLNVRLGDLDAGDFLI